MPERMDAIDPNYEQIPVWRIWANRRESHALFSEDRRGDVPGCASPWGPV